MRGLGMMRAGLAAAGLLMAGTAWAQGPGGGPGMGSGMGPGMGPGMGDHRPPMERSFGGPGVEGRWWNNPRLVEKLKLTDDQRKAFDQILLEHRTNLIDLHANLEKAELSMEPLVSADQPDEGRILAQIDKVAQARAELEKANARYLLALRAKLTPEQWKAVQELRKNHGGPEQRGGWDGRRPGDQRDHKGPGGANGAPPQGPGPTGMLDDDSAPEPPAATAPGGGDIQ